MRQHLVIGLQRESEVHSSHKFAEYCEWSAIQITTRAEETKYGALFLVCPLILSLSVADTCTHKIAVCFFRENLHVIYIKQFNYNGVLKPSAMVMTL